ncbi:MAG TPA: histidine phosphatase family protein [Caulobacteraceae bacterium]
MRRLILLRHGKAESTAATGGDFERGLTESGRRESALIGHALARTGCAPDLALVSTARRAMETWEAAQGAFPQARMAPARALYHASADALAEAIDAAGETVGALMIVGHNPGLHELALTLMVSPRSRVEKTLAHSFPTASAAVFQLHDDGRFEFERFLTPRDATAAG